MIGVSCSIVIFIAMQPVSRLQLQIAPMKGVTKVHTECMRPSSSVRRRIAMACALVSVSNFWVSGPVS
jgi:ABC-type transport system involved in cytochrome c biogenesis ATPase subunit